MILRQMLWVNLRICMGTAHNNSAVSVLELLYRVQSGLKNYLSIIPLKICSCSYMIFLYNYEAKTCERLTVV